MAPTVVDPTSLHVEKRRINEDNKLNQNGKLYADSAHDTIAPQYKLQIVWRNVIIFVILHIITVIGWWKILTLQSKILTFLWSILYVYYASTGVTGGAHRLWAHRTYKSKLPFRIWLMLAQSAALQNDIYTWVRDHRVHHKFTDTNADPHNSTRGFFFCHMGWLMAKKHPDVIEKGYSIDMSDVEADPVVRWQRKYYIPLVLTLTFLLPTFVPYYFWGERLSYSFYICVTRYVMNLHGTWLVNSAAHLWGYRPYDSSINPVENHFVSAIGFGEGWHNYHHTFPWDYKAAELGNYTMNFTTGMLDLMAYCGQIYDLKTVSEEMIRKRALRTGDGSWRNEAVTKSGKHVVQGTNERFLQKCVWGWGDKDMDEEEKQGANISYVSNE